MSPVTGRATADYVTPFLGFPGAAPPKTLPLRRGLPGSALRGREPQRRRRGRSGQPHADRLLDTFDGLSEFYSGDMDEIRI